TAKRSRQIARVASALRPTKVRATSSKLTSVPASARCRRRMRQASDSLSTRTPSMSKMTSSITLSRGTAGLADHACRDLRILLLAWSLLRRPRARLVALTLGLAAYSLGGPLRLIGVEPFLPAALVSMLGYFGLLALAGWLIGRARPTIGPEALIALMPLLLYP